MLRFSRAALGGVVLVCLVAACQPEVSVTATPPPTPVASGERRGAPDSGGVPTEVDAIVEATRETALRWQDEPVPAELRVVVEDGVATSAEVIWLAGDADRLQVVTLDASGSSEDRPTLATVGALPVSADGLAEVPAPPVDLLGPVALVDAAVEALGACGAGASGPVQVDYATGAPFDWNGEAFDTPPTWTATVGLVGQDGGVAGARVDPSSGSGTGDCFEVAGAPSG